MTENIEARITGVARGMQRRFSLSFDCLDDLIQSAWVYYLERGCDDERTWNYVQGHLRLEIIVQLFGRVPHQGMIKGLNEVLYEPLEDFCLLSDYSTEDMALARIELEKIAERCSWADNHPKHYARSHHAETLRNLMLYENGKEARRAGLDRRKFTKAVDRLRKFLAAPQYLGEEL